MNKKIIPAEASFFVPVEKVLFDHSRMRRSLETAAAENYPALTEDIMWDYTLFTFEKKKWALISITDRSTYGEECIRHSSRPNSEYVLYSYGEPVGMTNDSGTLSYIYDKAGLLTKETDEKTSEAVSYFYDKAGRRTRLISRERDISYGYGRNGEILTQKDRAKQLEIHYKYDACGRETERRFGNGVRQLTFYDKAGRTICIKQVNSSDRLLSGEAYAYDKLGRRSMTVNEKGLVTIYKYDNQSRLETVYYPFNEDIKETARKEADKQGLYFQPSQGTAENYFLSTGELLQLKAVAECIANGRSGAITVNQVVWKESYTYDPNGNRTSKTTAWGTVQYAYDKENRLTESGNLGMSESVKYTYDANGNLLRESAARYRKDYTYNAQNRMSFSDVQDSVLNTRNFTEYAYDAFGRRIETKQYLGDYTRNLYDGFSFDVLSKSVLQSAYSANIPEQMYRTPSTQRHPELVSGSASNNRNAAGTEIGTRYRYIDDTPLVPLTEAGKTNGTSSSGSTAKTRSRPNNEYVLYSYGEPVGMTNDSGTSYFGTDILGSVRSVTDKYGAVQADYSYDAFGSPYLGNLENDVGFGYCGKSYDVGTGLYDYGFRDYSPISARFTTVDPIRDGSNWFSYVVNDPVNYVDPFGLNPVSDLIDGAKEFYGKAKDGVSLLIDNAKEAGKNVIGFVKDKYIDMFDPSFLNTCSDVLIAIPEHPEQVKSPESLIIRQSDLYLNPYDTIYSPATGIMYKATDGQSVAVAETMSGDLVFIEKHPELNIVGTVVSFFRGNSFPGKYETPLPSDLQDLLNIPVVSAAINIVNNNENTTSFGSSVGGDTNFNVSSIFENKSFIQNNDNKSIINNVMNGLCNNIVNGIGGLPLSTGCTK